MTVCIGRGAESVGKEGWREEEGGRGREREREREGGGERELYLDHGLTVDLNHFVQSLQSKMQGQYTLKS